jgi:hypothetical protein
LGRITRDSVQLAGGRFEVCGKIGQQETFAYADRLKNR